MDDARLIENLLYTYAERIDAGDLEGVAELFRHGAIAAPTEGSLVEGYEGALALYRGATRIYPDTGTPKTRHITTNAIIDVKGDTATSCACYTVVQGTDAFPLQPIISGRYEDEMRCRQGEWRFHLRCIQPTLLGDLSRHLLFDQSSLKG